MLPSAAAQWQTTPPPPSTDEIAKAALVNSYNNTQDINGFKVGDTIYDIENGQPKGRSATEDDVKADDFGGLGLKEVVAQHDQSLADLTETVNENSEALVKTAEVVNEISTDVKANKAAITTKADKAKLDEVSGKVTANETAIATKADKAKLDEVSGKVTANETAIATKANSADVYTKTQSDERFVRIDTSIGGLTTTADGLDTRLKTAEKTITEHGTRLASAEKSITEHGTRLNGLDRTVSDLRKETRQGLAEQAALSGLFQPYNVGRFNVTAAVGGYKSESAVAIGTGFRFTENFAAKAGVAVGTSSGSSAAYHVGVNYEW
ncbi:YadA C-terminal domain-containing protein [Neisseria meningitidis]|uniref:YadA C-terminal domain-containing protein n=1 Tax=Neisseria meningitidis TaxID=487 RepID=UPI0038FCBF69